jgi:hypothetical protein
MEMVNREMARFTEGQRVVKETGDYKFEGEIRSVFSKRSGAIRYCVENDEGIIHIFSEHQLVLKAFAIPDHKVLAPDTKDLKT